MSKITTTSITGLALSEAARSDTPACRTLLAGAGAAAALALGIASAPAATLPHLDAGLVQLGTELRQANAELEAFDAAHPEEDLDATMVPCYAIIERIRAATAHTLAGLQVKAMAVAWCNGTDLDTLDPGVLDCSNSTPTDEQVMATIVQDLLAMGRAAAAGAAA